MDYTKPVVDLIKFDDNKSLHERQIIQNASGYIARSPAKKLAPGSTAMNLFQKATGDRDAVS